MVDTNSGKVQVYNMYIISQIHILYFIPASRPVSISLYYNRQLYPLYIYKLNFVQAAFYIIDRVPIEAFPRRIFLVPGFYYLTATLRSFTFHPLTTKVRCATIVITSILRVSRGSHTSYIFEIFQRCETIVVAISNFQRVIETMLDELLIDRNIIILIIIRIFDRINFCRFFLH